VFTNDSIGSGAAKSLNGVPLISTPPSLDGTRITQSENLVLSLLGGLNFDAAVPAFTYSEANIGRGPTSLNPAKPKLFSPYSEAGENVLGKKPYKAYAGALATNTVIPEFLDGWGGEETMPIVYVRARVGAAGIAGITLAEQYDTREFTDYGFQFGTGAGFDFPDAATYLKHPSLTNTPVNKDGYVLIAAGKDRKFGTKDDLTNFGNFK
jgi:hypothetical protein